MRLLDLEIYAWVARYLRGAATLDEFEDWFVPETWHVERSGNVPAIELADAIRTPLADATSGEIDEAEFRTLLESLEKRRTARIRFFQDALGVSPVDSPLSRTLDLIADPVAE